MNTKTLAATAILALMLTGIATVAFAHPNPISTSSHQTQQNQTTASNAVQSKDPEQKGDHGKGGVHNKQGYERNHPPALTLKVGDTITLSSLDGRFRQVGNESIRGNASGSFTFTVTGAFKAGYALSITSGTIKIGDQTYTVNSGSVQTGPYGRELVGQGTAGNGVQFLMHATIRGTSTTPHGMVMLDLQNGTTEYMVLLRATPSS